MVHGRFCDGGAQWDTEQFLLTIRQLYGRWPSLLVTDHGHRYRAIPIVLAQLKRRKASFAWYFPKGSVQRVKECIWIWAGRYNFAHFSVR